MCSRKESNKNKYVKRITQKGQFIYISLSVSFHSVPGRNEGSTEKKFGQKHDRFHRAVNRGTEGKSDK